MGCSSSKQSVKTNKVAKLDIKRPQMNLTGKEIQLFFVYEFKANASQEIKEKIFQLWEKLNEWFKTKGAYGTILYQLTFTRLTNGWEAKEVFRDGAVYAKHVENMMASPYVQEVFSMQEYWEEKEAWIKCLASEEAKAPQLAEFYPNTKRFNCSPFLKGDPRMHIGYMNGHDGCDEKKRGGSIVIEFEVLYKSADCKPKVMAVLDKLIKKMRNGNEFGPVFSHLVFWHNEDGTGYNVVEIIRSAEFYDQHCLFLADMLEDLMSMKDLIELKKSRLHGLKAEIEASKFIPMNFADVPKVYGTPNVTAWGPSFFGWAN